MPSSLRAPVILELPGTSIAPRECDADLILLIPPAGRVEEAGLEHARVRLSQNPTLVAIVDLPAQEATASLALDFLLRPECVSAVLIRAEALSACLAPVAAEGSLARAQLAARLACALEVERADSALAAAPAQSAASDRELASLAREVLGAFAVEDLYPVLRSSEGAGRVYASILDCAAKLLERGRRPEGFALGAWAEALVEGRDCGLGLGLAQAATGNDQSADPMISVIVPTLNRPQMLARALASLAAQSMSDLEVIVVNDGGADPSTALDPFRHTVGGGGRLSVVNHDRNRGLAAARNTGLRMARGRYVAFLDDDDRLLPHHFAALVPQLRLGARIVHGDVRSVLEVPAQPLPRTKSLLVHYQFAYEPAVFPIENCFPVQSLLCERELLFEAGGFDETLPVLEDWDLWLRVFQLAEPVHVPRVTSEVRQRSDGSNMTAQNQSRWSEVCAHIYGKTLDFERSDSRLRQRRLAYLLKLAEDGRHPFPAEAEVWLRGAPDLWPIDPENPIPKQPSPRV